MNRTLLCAFLLAAQIHPLGRSHGSMGLTPSTISGRVQTQSGQPIPLATVAIKAKASEDSRQPSWPGTVVVTKQDGFFRSHVPGDATFEVCASVPGKQKQCQTVVVEERDLQVATFVF